MERFVRNRPGDDLAHPLHRPVAGEVEEHHEARKELHPFREGRERRDAGRKAVLVVFGDFVEEVVLRGHRFVLKEFVVDGFGKPERFDQVRVRGDVHRFARGEGRKHHAHFGLPEAREVALHVGARDVDVALGEKAQDLREEVLFAFGELPLVVLHVLHHGDFGPEPVHLLRLHEGFVGPRIAEGLEVGARGEQPLPFGRGGRSNDRLFIDGGFGHGDVCTLCVRCVSTDGQPSQARHVVSSATAFMLMSSSMRRRSLTTPTRSALRSLSERL